MALGIPAALRVIGRSFVDWWDSWLDMVLVTVVWFIAQITVIFGPPATFGYYYVVSNMVNGQSTGLRGLIEGARKYFKPAWLWGGINILVLFVTSFAVWFYLNVEAAWGLYAAFIVLMIGYMWLCTQFYGLPYFIALEQPDLKTALKNGILTTLAAPFFTVILMIVVAIVLGLSFVLILPLLLGLPGLIPVLGVRGMHDRLVAFGLRQREKTPKEIEAEQGARIFVPEFDREPEEKLSVRGKRLRAGGAPGEDVADGEGQVEQEK